MVSLVIRRHLGQAAGSVCAGANPHLLMRAICSRVTAGRLQETKDILAPVSPITSRTDAIELKYPPVAPPPHATDANLQEIGYLPGGQHGFQLGFSSSTAHDRLLVIDFEIVRDTGNVPRSCRFGRRARAWQHKR